MLIQLFVSKNNSFHKTLILPGKPINNNLKTTLD